MAAKGFFTALLFFSCVLICASQSSDETTNQLRQVVPISANSSSGLNPVSGANVQNRSVDTIDDFSITGTANTNSSNKKKNVHAILSVVGWGILFPIGVYLRVSCGCPILGCILCVAGYIIGVSGWVTGMKLDSPGGTTHKAHKILGILIFVFVHFDRIRFCSIALEGIPAVTVILSIVNIYLGFDILQPDHHKWRNIYTGVLIFFGCIASVFEITKCIICCLFGPGDFCYNRIENADDVAAQRRNQPRARGA